MGNGVDFLHGGAVSDICFRWKTWTVRRWSLVYGQRTLTEMQAQMLSRHDQIFEIYEVHMRELFEPSLSRAEALPND